MFKRNPKEVKYLEKIEKIIRDAKYNITAKTKKESDDY